LSVSILLVASRRTEPERNDRSLISRQVTLVASKHPQQLLTRALYNDRPNRLGKQIFATGNVIEARTFRSALLQHSGEFLKAPPIPGLGLTMSPKDFRLS
jgi:hypothetical protein